MSASPTMTVVVATPDRQRIIEDVVRVRFEAPDGHRGVLPGHEPALASLRSGAIHVTRRGERPGEELESFLASEGGLASISPTEVRLLSRWAAEEETLEALLARLERRAASRRRVEHEARAVLARHDAALRRALAALQREVHG